MAMTIAMTVLTTNCNYFMNDLCMIYEWFMNDDDEEEEEDDEFWL